MEHKSTSYQITATLLGILGLFGCYITAFYHAIHAEAALVLYPMLLGIIFYTVYTKRKNVTWILLGLIVLYSVLSFQDLLSGAKALYNGMVDTYARNDSYVFPKYPIQTILQNGTTLDASWLATKTMLYLFAIYAMVLAILIRQRFGYLLMIMLTLSIYISTLLYKTSPFILCSVMTIAFCLLLLLLSSMKKHQLQEAAFTLMYRRVLLGSVCICLLFMVVMPKPFFKKSSTVENLRLNIALQIEDIIMRNTQPVGEIDLRKAGNRFYNHTTHLKVTSSIKQQLYLKEFSGSIFEQDVWRDLSKDRYENSLIDYPKIYSWIPAYEVGLSNQPTLADLTIEDERPRPYYAPQPYYLNDFNTKSDYYYDAYIKAGDGSYTYQFWSNEDLQLLQKVEGNVNYIAFTNNSYTKVPSDVKQLFDQFGLYRSMKSGESRYDIAYPMIKDFLAQQATYTLTPGNTPDTKGFIDYFLNENKKGYCVHFATTATMLFRYLKIPARYVEGYRVDMTAFDEHKEAMVKDSDAHAWVEVFDEKKGWIPLEVTPAAPIQDDPNSSDQPTADQPNQTQNPNGTGTTDEPADRPGNGQKDPTSDTVDPKKDTGNLQLLIATAGMIAVFAGVFIQRGIRYRKWRNRMKQQDRRNAVIACLSYLDKWEPYHEIDVARIEDILDKARYSSHPISEEEYRQVHSFTLAMRKQLLHDVKLMQLIKLYFWDALL